MAVALEHGTRAPRARGAPPRPRPRPRPPEPHPPQVVPPRPRQQVGRERRRVQRRGVRAQRGDARDHGRGAAEIVARGAPPRAPPRPPPPPCRARFAAGASAMAAAARASAVRQARARAGRGPFGTRDGGQLARASARRRRGKRAARRRPPAVGVCPSPPLPGMADFPELLPGLEEAAAQAEAAVEACVPGQEDLFVSCEAGAGF